ncbi:Peroxiredoxin-4 [Chelonia mydas]|uniref:thioredoxin-dependent peroxiredoxin n=1 Tax=Chelonia mydas TaxID=8469 RepID=M7ARY8_CHEMY|nr:Peroxiredoxin-4 [Chelonia mydas]
MFLVSKPAPYWEGTAVINGEFKELKLTDYQGKYLVFFFYPLDFTFVCPTEIIAFSDRIEEFRAINTEVVACSVDSQFTHLAWINTPRKQGGLGPMKIPLLSDLTHQISKDYGVYLEDQGHTLRGLFIIDDKRVLRQITMNDLPVGRSVDETLRLVQAFQYTDKHGEGACFQYFGNGNYAEVLFSLGGVFSAIRKRGIPQHLIASWLLLCKVFCSPHSRFSGPASALPCT